MLYQAKAIENHEDGETMTTEYVYESITEEPNLGTWESGILTGGIHYDVENSAMTDKTIEGCCWSETNARLTIVFTNELSAGYKTILDGIVGANS